METDGVKHEETKDQIKKEYITRVRNILKAKLNGETIILVINSRALFIVRYVAGIISWTTMELEELDRRTRKLMTMYEAHHPKANVEEKVKKKYKKSIEKDMKETSSGTV